MSKNVNKPIENATETLDMKVDILTTALIKEMQSPEFQNEYTYGRRAQTLRVFADLIESLAGSDS